MRMLLAIDLFSAPQAVLMEAAGFAERLGATLDLLYVDESLNAMPVLADPSLQLMLVDEQRAISAKREEDLASLLALCPQAIQGRALYRRGIPAPDIVEAAEGYDVLVVATHGRVGLAHLWMGSVAERVIRQAKIPVLTLRLPAEP